MYKQFQILFLFVSCLLINSISNASITLKYKTANGYIPITAVNDGKLIAEVNGKPNPVNPSNLFSLEASMDDLLDYAIHPPFYSITRNTKDPDSANRNFMHSFNIHGSGLKLMTSPAFKGTIISKSWDVEDEQNTKIVVAWFHPDELSHPAELSHINYKYLTDKNSAARFKPSHAEKRRLLPAILLFGGNGKFVKPKETKDRALEKAIISSLIRDDSAALQALITENKRIVRSEFFEGDLLHWAVGYKSHKCMEVLLANDARLNGKYSDHFTPLMLASGNSDTKSVAMLLKAGANIKSADSLGNTPLHSAAHIGNNEIVKALLDAGASIDKENIIKWSPVYMAAAQGQNSTVKLLLENGSKFKLDKDQKQFLLFRALRKNSLDELEFILSRGAKADLASRNHYPIFEAARWSSGQLIDVLVENGADVNRTKKGGMTPVMIAALHNYDGLLALLKHGADPNAITEAGATALHLAITENNLDATRFLLQNGADPNLENPDGVNLLWWATMVGDRMSLNELISAGAVCKMTPETAMPLMDYAFRHNIPEIVEITIAQCLEPDFRFYDAFPNTWVAERYGAELIGNYLNDITKSNDSMGVPEFKTYRDVRNHIKVKNQVSPKYPRDLQKEYGEFLAVLDAIIDVDGSVRFPVIIENPANEMSENIVNALSRWQFEPIVMDGKPVRVRLEIPIQMVPSLEDERVYDIEAADQKPRPLRIIEPVYPPGMKRKKIEGEVMLEFVVTVEGNVDNVEVVSATHREFVMHAVDAMRRWKFSPGYVDGDAVNVLARVPLRFSIQK